MTKVGHNSESDISAETAGQLRTIVERVERLEEEKRQIADDIKGIFAEAKSNGFDTKTIRRIVALRRVDKQKRDEAEAVLEVYLRALGMA